MVWWDIILSMPCGCSIIWSSTSEKNYSLSVENYPWLLERSVILWECYFGKVLARKDLVLKRVRCDPPLFPGNLPGGWFTVCIHYFSIRLLCQVFQVLWSLAKRNLMEESILACDKYKLRMCWNNRDYTWYWKGKFPVWRTRNVEGLGM